MKKIVGLLSLVLLGGCSSNKNAGPVIDDNTITFNDFEGGGGWSNDPGRNNPSLLDKGRAHSGRYAIKADKDHEFSLTFDMPLAAVSPRKFKTLHLDAWVFMPSAQAAGVLGIQVMEADGSKQTYGEGIHFDTAVKEYNKWVAVGRDFVLPDNITPTQHLRLSLWRGNATEEILVDDVKLSIVN